MGYTKSALDFLIKVLSNEKEHFVTRHEAAEALGNMYSCEKQEKLLEILEKYSKHE